MLQRQTVTLSKPLHANHLNNMLIFDFFSFFLATELKVKMRHHKHVFISLLQKQELVIKRFSNNILVFRLFTSK